MVVQMQKLGAVHEWSPQACSGQPRLTKLQGWIITWHRGSRGVAWAPQSRKKRRGARDMDSPSDSVHESWQAPQYLGPLPSVSRRTCRSQEQAGPPAYWGPCLQYPALSTSEALLTNGLLSGRQPTLACPGAAHGVPSMPRTSMITFNSKPTRAAVPIPDQLRWDVPAQVCVHVI